jgi:hypothetical protein
MLPDIAAALSFFMTGRDPQRWVSLTEQLLHELQPQPQPQSGVLDRLKYLGCVEKMLSLWTWRGKFLFEAYVKLNPDFLITDTEKVIGTLIS